MGDADADHANAAIRDEVVRIEDGRAFGLLSRRAGGDGRIVVVLLNAGLIHRVGPFRMYVHLARDLARRGFDVFRFDMPRVGDGAGDGVQSIEDAVRAALDAATRATGAREIVVGGICNAADLAWRIAQLDDRVSGLWLFDGFAARGAWFRWGRLRKGLSRPLVQWSSLAWKLVRRIRSGSAAMDMGNFRDWATPPEFRAQAASLLARGVRILAMYTGGVSRYLLDRRQFGTTFGAASRDPRLALEFWPEIDHILLSPVDRDRVIARVGDWSRTL